jgi:hypothetical protein
MEEIVIYKFQLESIKEALRLTQNIYVNNKQTGETCFDRQVNQAKKFSENALEGKKDEQVPYI